MRRQHLRNKALTIFENLLLIYAAPKDRQIKFLKISMLLLRRINIWVVIYLDDILVMGFGFYIKLEISIMNSVQEIDFLDVTINSLKMCLSSSQEKV